MNKQEAIKRVEQMGEYERFVDEPVSKNSVLNIISQIHEPKKVAVPKYVADWYEKNKDDFECNLYDFFLLYHEGRLQRDLNDWFTNNRNKPIVTLVKMKLYGYEVEKEKLYTVELPNPNAGGHVVLCKTSDGIVSIFFTGMARWRGGKNFQLTEAEIKKDFAWAWEFAEVV